MVSSPTVGFSFQSLLSVLLAVLLFQMRTGTYLCLLDRLPARCPETLFRETYL